MTDSHDVAAARSEWQAQTLEPTLRRLGVTEPTDRFYAPDDIPGFDFLTRVGFPGRFPFTAGTYPTEPGLSGARGAGRIPQSDMLVRAGRYSGYGSAEDTAHYYQEMIDLGRRAGPNLAFDLPTQCGYDSDAPMARGEVGRTGVAVDSMDDFRTIYQPFVGALELDRIASNWTINAPAAVVIAMYYLLAIERGINPSNLRATPQNDILKEFIARGTYIFPPAPSMRLTRDIFRFVTDNMPNMNVVSAGGYHLREAGASREQDLGISMSNATTYLQTAVDAGIDIDLIAPRVTFNAFGGSVDLLAEVAFQRAARRLWASIVRDRFGARQERSLLLRQASGAHMGYHNATVARPLNNLARAVVGGIAAALSGYTPAVEPPFDEALGLGWSREGIQLSEDAARILAYEARLATVRDPLAGSYYVESLTDQIEADARALIASIDGMGGSVAAIESGFLPKIVTESGVRRIQDVASGERIVVGVNAFTGPGEIDVTVRHDHAHPYDQDRIARAEQVQTARLRDLRRRRDGVLTASALSALGGCARRDDLLLPPIIDCLRADATVGEICDALRDVFGEYTGLDAI